MAAGTLHNVRALIYVKFKLQLRNNKYSIHVYPNKYTDLKFRKKKSYNAKNTHLYNGTYLLPKPFKQRHIDVTSFRLAKSLPSRPVLFTRTNNFRSHFQNHLDHRICETKFSYMSASLFFHFLFF